MCLTLFSTLPQYELPAIRSVGKMKEYKELYVLDLFKPFYWETFEEEHSGKSNSALNCISLSFNKSLITILPIN